jgi:hypothetical protein
VSKKLSFLPKTVKSDSSDIANDSHLQHSDTTVRGSLMSFVQHEGDLQHQALPALGSVVLRLSFILTDRRAGNS